MSKPRHTSKVYRLRGLPGHVDRLEAVGILSRSLQDVGRDDIHIRSLAAAVDPWERQPTRTATLTFEKTPALIAAHSELGEWKIPVTGLGSPLLIDTHFFGLTALNDVSPAEHRYDCIAISGLASHPFGSWQPHGEDKSFMWIRDVMPNYRPSTRFLVYGYDTAMVNSRSFQSIPDLSWSLISDLKANGWVSPTTKPLIFLAHSLGGVVLKQALVMLAGSGEREKFLLSRVKGAIFFGVPSTGMVTSHLLAVVKDQPNRTLLDDLSEGSPYLHKLEKQFGGISYDRKMRFFWGYETRKSRTVIRTPGGSYSMSGPEVVLVTKESATKGLCSLEPASTIQFDESHSNMVKLGEGDHRLSIMASKLSEIEGADGHRAGHLSDRLDLSLNGGTKIIDNSDVLTAGKEFRAQNGPVSESESILDPTMWDNQAVRKSLHAAERDLRLEQIVSAKGHTFGWVFDDPSGFSKWLQKGQGIFWISGKPGSGKSTLMKFIYNDPRTNELLYRWGYKSTQIIASFFFHHRGSALQKSFEGLLRSIISQIVEAQPTLANILSPMLEQKLRERAKTEIAGTLSSDLVLLLERQGLIIEEEIENEISSMVRSQNTRAEIHRIFWDYFRKLDDQTAPTRIEESLMRNRKAIVGSKGPYLNELLSDICKATIPLEDPCSFKDLALCWKVKIDLQSRIYHLLAQQGVDVHVSVEREVEDVIYRQDRREAFRATAYDHVWTRSALQTALFEIFDQTHLDLDITLFLDAVDEYDGRPEFISTFLKDLVQKRFPKTSVRICCSSRQWTAFIEEFSDYPGFKIHEHTEEDIRQYSLVTIDESLPAADLLYELVPEIVQRAEGVFLWVRLVLQDLTKAANTNSGVDHQLRTLLRRTLESLPNQLNDYYRAIIERIPAASRWDTYVVLESISQSSSTMNIWTLMEVIECSTASNLEEVQRRVEKISRAPQTHAENRLRLLSGGLVEVVDVGRDWGLQLMHQTIKEFVEDTQFKHIVLGSLAKITHENGHSFLSKYHLFSGNFGQDFFYHAREAERTTGRSQYPVFSGISESFVRESVSTAIPNAKRHEIRTLLGVAIVAGLRQYLRDAVSADKLVFRNTSDSLMRALFLSLEYGDTSDQDVIEVFRLVTVHGYVITHAELKMLLNAFWAPDLNQEEDRAFLPNQILVPIISIVLGQNWQALYGVDFLDGRYTVGTALHLSPPPEVAERFLTGGGDANALTEDCRTPLDCLVHACPIMSTIAEIVNGEEACALACVLAQHGGSLLKARQEHWDSFIGVLRARGVDISAIEKAGLPRWHNDLEASLSFQTAETGPKAPSTSNIPPGSKLSKRSKLLSFLSMGKKL
ncbi:hypothetical protein GQ53DRAFT_744927 [Thozetella sp. PMI_491]|nr:hypothetical protein GQ53DRAFT_744927 [Thozetella sp. PMI_491]